MFTRIMQPVCRFADIKKKKNLYEILKIQRSATADELKASYYKLAKEHHPDTHQGASNVA